MLLLIIALCNSTVVCGFKYQIRNEELTAPQMLCFSGLPSSNSNTNNNNNSKKRRSYSLSANPCPNMDSKADLESYEAVVVDEAGYIQVQLTDIVMQSSSSTSSKHPNHRLQLYLLSLDDLIEQFDDNNNKTYNHQCCFQMEQNAPEYCSSAIHSQTSSSTVFFHDYRVQAPRIADPTTGSVSPPISTVTNATNTLQNLGTSTTATTLNKKNQVVDFVARLKPQRRGRHVVVLSNCASDIIIINNNNKKKRSNTTTTTTTRVVEPLTAFIRDIDVHFVFRFGELPLSLMGIIPFYGIIASCYAFLSITWILRSNNNSNNRCIYWAAIVPNICGCSVWNKYSKCYVSNSRRRSHPLRSSSSSTGSVAPLLGLQKAIRSVVFAQTIFCSIAFAYYLHLNWIADYSVDINVLYSGTAAALVHVWDPFSLLVAICHFGTILLAQCVVTLVTDGTWLIQHNIRTHTKRVLKILILLWMFYFALYAVMSTKQRIIGFAILLTFWIGCLLYNIHSSLKHLRAVMIGQSNEQILAVGGAIMAKRSIYRKMYGIVLLYPIIFVTSFIWTSCSQKDSWTWVGYVLGDLYLFFITAHASYVWLPRPWASHEYVKYVPLELLQVNGLEMWEGDFSSDDFD